MSDATEPVERPGLVEGLGPRVLRRAEPRTSIAVAGGGCALAVLGVLILSGDVGTTDDGDLNRWPGVVFCAAVVAAGFFIMTRFRSGALATGGSVAAALGVPPLMFFLTFDSDSFPPYSTDGILIVSTLVWLVAYFFGPSSGRPFFLGAGLVGLWLSILQVVEDVFDAPFVYFADFAVSFDPEGTPFGPSGDFDPPDLTTMGILSLLLGVGYFVWMRKLDHTGRHGMATPVAAAMIPVLASAPLLLADDFETEGAGLVTMALGAALAFFGSPLHRRVVTWVGGAGVAIGAAIFLGEMTDNATVGGMLYLGAGIAIVFAAHAWAQAQGEPDEMQVTPIGSRFVAIQTGTPAPPPENPPPPF